MLKWGTFATIPPCLAFVRYCIKGRSMGGKIGGFFLLTMCTSHIYVLGQYYAVYRNLKSGLDSFCIDTNYELGSQMENFFFLLRQRSDLQDKGVEIMSDQDFLTMIYDDVFNMHKTPEAVAAKEAATEVGNKYVTNNYFARNKDKFTKRGSDDSDESRVFLPDEGVSTSSQPLKYFDNFFTRYVYQGQVRWWTNIGKWFKIIEDN